MTWDEEAAHQLVIDNLINSFAALFVKNTLLYLSVYNYGQELSRILQTEKRVPDLGIATLKLMLRILTDNQDKIDTMSKEIFQNIPGIQSIERSIESLLAKGHIDQTEYDRLKQMCWASYEDLVMALEITYNLCEKHGILNARIKNCKLVPPPENIFQS